MYWHYHLLLVDQMYNIAGKINFTKKGFTSLDDTADADKIVKGLISNKRDNGQLCFYPGFKLTYTLSSLRIYWRLLMILKTSNKSVWRNDFWYLKVCIFWKCIRYTIHWDKTQMLKNLFRTKYTVPKIPWFFIRKLQLISLAFDLRFLHELKHKTHLSKTVCGIFHFLFRFVFIELYIFIQQNAWTLKLSNLFQN